MNNVMETKKCYKCGRTLPVTEFYKNRSTKDGLQSMCKDCIKERDAARASKTEKKMKTLRLFQFTPREIMEELSRRGYYGIISFDRKKEEEVEINGHKGIFTYIETENIDLGTL